MVGCKILQVFSLEPIDLNTVHEIDFFGDWRIFGSQVQCPPLKGQI